MFNNLIKQVSKIIVGNENKIKLTLAAILSEGSVLIEDNPGSGKTTFAKTITLNLGLNFKRIQFTSDLLPSDILGFNINYGKGIAVQIHLGSKPASANNLPTGQRSSDKAASRSNFAAVSFVSISIFKVAPTKCMTPFLLPSIPSIKSVVVSV